MSSIYISYSEKIDKTMRSIEVISKALKKRNHKVFTSSNLFPSKVNEDFNYNLAASDLFVVFLDKENTNSIFELGYAVGRGKKVLVVSEEEIDFFENIKDLPLVVGDISKIEFQRRVVSAVQELLCPKENRSVDAIYNLLTIQKLLQLFIDIENEERQDSQYISKSLLLPEIDSFIEKKRMLSNNVYNLNKALNIGTEPINPIIFEKFITNLLKTKFKIERNIDKYKTYDLCINNFKNYDKTFVQVKTLNSSSFLSIKYVLSFYKSLLENNADSGIIITNSNFSAQAVKFCTDNRYPKISLWNIDSLFKNTNFYDDTEQIIKGILKRGLVKKKIDYWEKDNADDRFEKDESMNRLSKLFELLSKEKE